MSTAGIKFPGDWIVWQGEWDAESAGEFAALNGEYWTANPYDRYERRWECWMRGWREGMREIERRSRR